MTKLSSTLSSACQLDTSVAVTQTYASGSRKERILCCILHIMTPIVICVHMTVARPEKVRS